MSNDKAKQARQKYEQVKKSSPPGEGSRFKALMNAAEASGAKNPAAVAAAAGRAKYGKAKMQQMAAKGKKK